MNDGTLDALPASLADVVLLAAIGPDLHRFRIDTQTAALRATGTTHLPENVQYAWPARTRRHLYVASSSGVPGGRPRPGEAHRLTAFAVDPETGALSPHGPSIALPARPIHLSTDAATRYVLVAFNDPAALRVYAIQPDATLGPEILARDAFDPGVYPHQVRVTSDDRRAILVSRGNDANAERAEEPGSLRLFRFEQGRLRLAQVVAPAGGLGFGPRHLDFHPSLPWVYVSVERQNRLDVFALSEGSDGRLGEAPLYSRSTLASPERVRPHQLAGAIHVHPNGRFVYVSNRASAVEIRDDEPVFAGGENTIAVFAIDMATGEPTLVQHAETQGIHCRNFHIDPSGSVLVASHITSLSVRDGEGSRFVPGRLSVFRIGSDGQLTFLHALDIELGDETMFWMGMLTKSEAT